MRSNSDFKKDTVNTSKSSFIRGAEFYKIPGASAGGYLILNLNGKDYIHRNVPEKVWTRFKGASSFGSYYNSNIKGKFRLDLGDWNR